jgi:hypothetical protein
MARFRDLIDLVHLKGSVFLLTGDLHLPAYESREVIVTERAAFQVSGALHGVVTR